MKKLNRRDFAKLGGAAVLVAPVLPSLPWPELPSAKQASARAIPGSLVGEQEPEPSKPDSKPKLTPEQEEAVKKAVERRERQLTAIRARTLPYDAEPSFVFRVRQRPRGAPRTS